MSELFTELPIGKFFENMVEKQPDHEFIIYPDRNLRFTYKEFDERVDNLAKGMLSIGIKPGDRVGIWAKNVPEWLTFMFACAKIGAAIVTVNTAYQSHELEYVLAQSEMKAIGMTDGFRDTSYFDIIHELVPEMLTSARGNLNSEKFPYLKYIIHVGQEKHRGMFNTNELLLLGMNYDDDEYQKIKDAVTQNDVINMQYTSGTEGFPKGVMLTSRNILNDGYYIGENMNYTEKDKLLLQVPLFHCFGTVLGVMAVITHGSTMVVLEEYDPLLAISSIQKEKCTSIYGVPTMFIGMMNHPMFEMFDMSSLRTGIMAGSTCPVETMKDAINNCLKECKIEHILIDAMPLELDIPTTSIIKGDLKSITISAASVIAKVTRDKMLYELDEKYPMYDFKHNVGYPTKKHLEAIKEYGIIPEHRRSYGPVKEYIEKEEN